MISQVVKCAVSVKEINTCNIRVMRCLDSGCLLQTDYILMNFEVRCIPSLDIKTVCLFPPSIVEAVQILLKMIVETESNMKGKIILAENIEIKDSTFYSENHELSE